MLNILITIHIVITLLLIGTIVLQRSSKDGLSGLGGSGSNFTGIVSSKAVGNALSKFTYIMMFVFIVNCLLMANLATKANKQTIVEQHLETNVIEHEADELNTDHLFKPDNAGSNKPEAK
ncbi:MAG: preprotein translocase subunit SecG [Pseudomonadota bacterium]